MFWSILSVAIFNSVNFANAAEFEFGFSKVDITPLQGDSEQAKVMRPLRLSGYGSRDNPYEAIEEQLFVRSIAIKSRENEALHVLVSVDTIGFPGVLTKEIHDLVNKKHQIPRSRFVICCTHSHTAPHIGRGLSNLYSVPLSEAEQAATDAYTSYVRDQVVVAVDQAIADLQPGKILQDHGEATFARNRRVLKDGIWTGFGENPSGPVDHSLPMLRITTADGKTTRGLIFNYACHCTTFGGEHNRVNGDWAGYAAKYLEAANAGAVAMCTIGCGADANPERNRDHAFEIAQRQGQEIADEVTRLINEKPDQLAISHELKSSFGFAGLPIDRPSDAELQEGLKHSRQQVRHHAEVMIETKKRMGRLPETYPMPIQVWRFGNQFAMVFLGGEVCVDYALRIKKELAEKVEGLTQDRIWVSAYSNDVFAYVAPERMRAEGGYEVDFSMIYYLQPGRWSSGTEDVILRRVHELFEAQSLDVPLSVNEALKTFSLPDGFQIEVVAAEPLIRDPINFAVDAAGRLWVVEMGDYPRGNPEEDLSKVERHEPWDGPPAGRIKVLLDHDRDGTYDEAKLFLDGLAFPTGVFPWRDGVLISGAPDIIFARDRDGDFKCDETEVLYSGFDEANPQHRIGGFEYGLDGWLYLSAGTNNHEIKCHKTGEVVNISGRDCRIHPDSGKLEPVSGRSQYGRCRDDFGNWYGNTNSEPLFQYVIEDGYLSRNPHVPSPSPKHHLTEPARAPPVYPTSRTLDRFNDLFALDRFTSACSPQVIRNAALGDEYLDSVLICEPVHNLVSRVVVDTSTIEFTGRRADSEQQSEFFSSTDNWFRPVRIMNAPDGSLWVCDMYRFVIEHPEWIPEAWQAKLDLYAGYDKGRIYRISRKEWPATPIEDLSKLTALELVNKMKSNNAWVRDTAQRLIVEKSTTPDPALDLALQHLIHHTADSRVFVQGSSTLRQVSGNENLSQKVQRIWVANYETFKHENIDILIHTLRTWATIDHDVKLREENLNGILWHPSKRVQFEVVLAAGELDEKSAASVLSNFLRGKIKDPWLRAALLSSSNGVAQQLIYAIVKGTGENQDLLSPLLATLIGNDPVAGVEALAQNLQQLKSKEIQRTILLTTLQYLERQQISFANIRSKLKQSSAETISNIIAECVNELSQGESAEYEFANHLMLASFDSEKLSKELALKYLNVSSPTEVNSAAVEALIRLGAIEELIEVLPQQTPAVQTEIQSELLLKLASTKALLTSLEEGQLKLSDLAISTHDALTNHRTDEIRERFSKLMKSQPQQASRGDVIAAFQSALTLAGNSDAGRIAFEKRCSTCHKHAGIGQDFGPSLASLLSKPNDYFLTAILDPNAAAEAKYRGYSIATTDGKVYSGLIVEETATSLKLVRPDGKQETILRRDVEEMVNSGRSFMPEGLEKELTQQDIADILAFLRDKNLPATSTQ